MTKAFASSIEMSSGTIMVNVLTMFPTNDQDLIATGIKGTAQFLTIYLGIHGESSSMVRTR
jgi:hypothetical protein